MPRGEPGQVLLGPRGAAVCSSAPLGTPTHRGERYSTLLAYKPELSAMKNKGA